MNELQVKSEPCEHDIAEQRIASSFHITTVSPVKQDFVEMEAQSIEELLSFDTEKLQCLRSFQYRRLRGIRSNAVTVSDMGKEQILTQAYADLEDLPEVDSPPSRKRKSSGGKRTGKSGKNASGTPYTTVPLPPCKVCGGVATGYHFGVITCEACKV